ncbi:MAG: esterase-like activity of phytase family protein [Gemmatimonadaceae bacterium]|nr:esterase-like activity of phytase family protein [Gemmatimonadaceae bacterium]
MKPLAALLTATLVATATPAPAQTVSNAQFVNGIAVAATTLDNSAGSAFDRRVGMFSGLFYDPMRGEWWGVSDRGPGGGTLPYETRVQRFTLDVDLATGRISNFQVQATVKFTSRGAALSGLAPNPVATLGSAFDPEGIVINPLNGNILVSDEYGPSVVEFNRAGEEVRRFTVPANLVPRNAVTGAPNFASDAGNTAGKANNRGFEGLAITPDGKYAYATLQSAMLDEGAGSGFYTRIVKYDMATGEAVGQYLYKFERTGQGRGVSELVALGNDRFLIIERNNRGIGIGAALTPADKSVFQIDLAGATDVSAIAITNGVLPAGVVPVAKSAQIIDLDADRLAALGNLSPEKWEGLAIGPRLADGRYLVLAGSDNDYSVTQNGAGTQFDVWLNFLDADPYATSIQCPLGLVTGCVRTTDGSAVDLTASYAMLPGVLHAYAADIPGLVSVVPEPATGMLLVVGLGVLALILPRTPRRGA